MARPSKPCLKLVGELVGFDTVSHRSNSDLIAYIRDFLAAHDIDSRLDEDASGHKANLFATIGPTDRGGLMLAGHTDVVPVEGSSSVKSCVSLKRILLSVSLNSSKTM